MLLSNKKAFTLTFLLYAVFANAHIHQRDHSNLKRFLRKRAPPQGDLSLVAGAAPAVPTFPSPSSTSDTASVTSILSSSTSTSLPVSISTSHSLTVSSQSSTSTSSSTSETSISTSQTSTSSSISSISSSTSAIATPSAVVVTMSKQAPVSSILDTPATTPTSSQGIVTVTTAVDASASATVIPETSGNVSSPNKSTTVTALIITASSVAAIAILWTVFRKWKLGHSSKFDERLQPIDWRPTTDDDGALPGHHRRHSGASSFHSAGHLPSSHGHSSSDHGHGSNPSYALPDHDFTAGPAHLAPVGGYADLARGPSPQPQMNQASGATLIRPPYGVGIPLHQGHAS